MHIPDKGDGIEQRKREIWKLFGSDLVEQNGYWYNTEKSVTHKSHYEQCKQVYENFDHNIQGNFLKLCRKGIPPQFRWKFWKEKIMDISQIKGQHPPGLYNALKDKKHQWYELIKIDCPRTFPEITAFDNEGQKMLLNILNALCVLEPTIGYCQGMNFVGAFVLMVAGLDPNEEEDCFWFIYALLNSYELKGFYRDKFPLLHRYIRAFDLCIERGDPQLSQHMRKLQVSSSMFLHQWLLTMFVASLPLASVAMFWDFILCTGTNGLLVVSLAVWKVIGPSAKSFDDMERLVKWIRDLKNVESVKVDLQVGVLILRKARDIANGRIDLDVESIIHVSTAELDADVLKA